MALQRLTDLRPPSLSAARGPFSVLLLAATLGMTAAELSRAALPPGAVPCATTSSNPGYGAFVLLKHANYTQSSASSVTASDALASIELHAPALYSISNAIASGPGSFSATLARQSDGSSLWSETGTEAAITAKIPAGVGSISFRLGFTNGDSFIGFFPFTLSAATPATPQIANYDAAQNVTATTAFNLSWNAWVGATTNDRVNVTLVDASGTTVFSAATDCTGQTSLAPTDSSVAIPAGRLLPNVTYTGYLTFGASLGGGADESTQIIQRTFHSRTTRFTLKTAPGGSGNGSPGTLEGPKVSGTDLVFTLRGTSGDVHRIESTTDLATWTRETEVTIPPTGTIEVKLALPTNGLPKFYRAVAIGSSTPTTDPAQLGITLVGARDLDISVTGTVGSTYNIELTFDGTAWTRIASTTIAAPNTPSVIRVTIPEGQSFALVRAVAVAAPPPPVELKAPTLSVVLTNGGFGAGIPAIRIGLAGGTPRKIYTLEQRSTASGAGWVSSSQTTVATDANGNGSLLIFVGRGFPGPGSAPTVPSGFLYRAVIR